MKLLLDQNLSRKLVPALELMFPGTSHVFLLGLHTWADSQIWSYARHQDYILATKNTDMVDLCVLRGAPPKVVWLRVGNCETAVIRDVLLGNEGRIQRFNAEQGSVVLSLFRLKRVE